MGQIQQNNVLFDVMLQQLLTISANEDTTMSVKSPEISCSNLFLKETLISGVHICLST